MRRGFQPTRSSRSMKSPLRAISGQRMYFRKVYRKRMVWVRELVNSSFPGGEPPFSFTPTPGVPVKLTESTWNPTKK